MGSNMPTYKVRHQCCLTEGDAHPNAVAPPPVRCLSEPPLGNQLGQQLVLGLHGQLWQCLRWHSKIYSGLGQRCQTLQAPTSLGL